MYPKMNIHKCKRDITVCRLVQAFFDAQVDKTNRTSASIGYTQTHMPNYVLTEARLKFHPTVNGFKTWMSRILMLDCYRKQEERKTAPSDSPEIDNAVLERRQGLHAGLRHASYYEHRQWPPWLCRRALQTYYDRLEEKGNSHFLIGCRTKNSSAPFDALSSGACSYLSVTPLPLKPWRFWKELSMNQPAFV